VTIPGAGTWYVLFFSEKALTVDYELFVVTAGSANVATRPVAGAPLPCTVGGGPLTIGPTTASVSPKGKLPFAATGGSNAGYVWSISTNASGGTISSTGAYTAGATGGVTDVVKVTDSAGASVTATVSVGAGITITPGSVTVQPHALQSFHAAGGSGSAFVWSMQASPSGGTIDPHGGIYSAGANGGADVVLVTDSLGNTATATVTVPDTSGCSAAGGATMLWVAGLAGLALWRRKAKAA
jgi:MYXO-CTERM domain-containing protein